MIEFTTSINGKQARVGVSYQHHRGYKEDPLRRMSKGEAQWEVISKLSNEYQEKLTTYNEQLKAWEDGGQKGTAPVRPNPPTTKSVKLALTGPDVNSGTTCQIIDLSEAKTVEGSSKLDFSSCTVLGKGHSTLSKLDCFSARTGRQDSLKRAVQSMKISHQEKEEFWDRFFEARKDELAQGWTESALKVNKISEQDKQAFLDQQRALLQNVVGSKVV